MCLGIELTLMQWVCGMRQVFLRKLGHWHGLKPLDSCGLSKKKRNNQCLVLQHSKKVVHPQATTTIPKWRRIHSHTLVNWNKLASTYEKLKGKWEHKRQVKYKRYLSINTMLRILKYNSNLPSHISGHVNKPMHSFLSCSFHNPHWLRNIR